MDLSSVCSRRYSIMYTRNQWRNLNFFKGKVHTFNIDCSTEDKNPVQTYYKLLDKIVYIYGPRGGGRYPGPPRDCATARSIIIYIVAIYLLILYIYYLCYSFVRYYSFLIIKSINLIRKWIYQKI